MYVTMAYKRGVSPSARLTSSAYSDASLPKPPGKPHANGDATRDVVMSDYNNASTTGAGGGAASDMFAGLPALQRRILQFIISEPKTDEGVHVAKIARSINEDAHLIRYAHLRFVFEHTFT